MHFYFLLFFFSPADTNMILHLLINQFRGLHERTIKLTHWLSSVWRKLPCFPWWHTRCLAFLFPPFPSLPPMETDLYGEEMSSVRQRADERNSRERRQKQTKAHSDPLMQEMERKNKIHTFSSCSSGEVTSSTVTWWMQYNVCKAPH